MYKRIKGKKFGRKSDQRRAFMRALATNLILRERIETTKIRARQVASMVEKLITKAKKNDLAAKKTLSSILPEVASRKLVAVVAPRFSQRQGGYTRITKIMTRAKDGAAMAIVELLDRPAVVEAKKGAKKGSKNKPEKKTKAEPQKTAE